MEVEIDKDLFCDKSYRIEKFDIVEHEKRLISVVEEIKKNSSIDAISILANFCISVSMDSNLREYCETFLSVWPKNKIK